MTGQHEPHKTVHFSPHCIVTQIFNPFTPTNLFGMFQIKAWTIPF